MTSKPNPPISYEDITQRKPEHRISARCPADIMEDIQREADMRGVSFSHVVVERLRHPAPEADKVPSTSASIARAARTVADNFVKALPQQEDQERFLARMRDHQRLLERFTSKFQWFLLPIASCPCREPEPWYVAPDHYEEMLGLCGPWVASGGFTLHEEKPLEWNQSMPWDKFTPNIPPLAFRTVGTGMRMALKYFRKMWFEVADVDKALEYLASHSALPLAVGGVDLIRYNVEEDYKAAVDLCDKYVLYWHDNHKPLPLGGDAEDFDDSY